MVKQAPATNDGSNGLSHAATRGGDLLRLSQPADEMAGDEGAVRAVRGFLTAAHPTRLPWPDRPCLAGVA